MCDILTRRPYPKRNKLIDVEHDFSIIIRVVYPINIYLSQSQSQQDKKKGTFSIYISSYPFHLDLILSAQLGLHPDLPKRLKTQWGKISFQFLPPGGSIGPRHVLQLLFREESLKLLITRQPLKLKKKYAHIWNP